MAKTKEEKLGDLFGLVCDDLTLRINDGVATSTDLNVARQLLKDNGITAAPAIESPLEGLANALPFPATEELKKVQEGR
jgi:hypothetical protein